MGKDSQDTLWATSLDSLVLNGLYIDSANKITKKIFYDNGKIKTKTLVKYSNEDQKIYERPDCSFAKMVFPREIILAKG